MAAGDEAGLRTEPLKQRQRLLDARRAGVVERRRHLHPCPSRSGPLGRPYTAAVWPWWPSCGAGSGQSPGVLMSSPHRASPLTCAPLIEIGPPLLLVSVNGCAED